MASPDSTRNTQVVVDSRLMVPPEPTRNTISQAKPSTTTVRMAVARLLGVCLMPTLARIAVSPAKIAEPVAYSSHMKPHASDQASPVDR